MRTDDLIRTLATDHVAPKASLRTSLAVALLAGLCVGAVLFALLLGPRPDIGAVAGDPRFLLKFVVTLALAAAAGGLLWRLIRPGAAASLWTTALIIGPALLALGILHELATLPAAVWPARMIGRNNLLCLASIPLLSAPIMVAVLYAARQGAPTRPTFAGAVSGLLAGGLGAALYAAHCIDDSPLFVATWYGLAITLMTLLGATLGSRLLRW